MTDHRRSCRTAVLYLLPIVLVACRPATSPPEAGEPVGLALDRARFVDLGHAYGPDTLYWPTATSGFELDELAYGPSEGGWFYSAYRLTTPEHGGTHLDAPIHFAAERWTVDRIPLDRLVVPAVVIDVSERAAGERDYRLTREDVERWEAEHGAIAEGTGVLLRTGWDRFWPDALAYLGDDTPGDASNLHFPAYGEEAARLLVEERGVALLGVDTASLDVGASTDFIVHRVAAEANVVGLENLTGLDRLPPTGAWVMALPMKVEGGSGGPVRVIAVVPDQG